MNNKFCSLKVKVSHSKLMDFEATGTVTSINIIGNDRNTYLGYIELTDDTAIQHIKLVLNGNIIETFSKQIKINDKITVWGLYIPEEKLLLVTGGQPIDN